MPTATMPRGKARTWTLRAASLDAVERLAKREQQADSLLARAASLLQSISQAPDAQGRPLSWMPPLDLEWLKKDIAAWRSE
jgi:hypothetical protein